MPQNKERKNEKGQINYKARLEKKLCLAKETPEPVFDVSDCNLKEIPSCVFVLCKVLRKEALYLQKNELSNLSSGGTLSDLKYIKLLDISSNKFTKLPPHISELETLEVLNISNNQLKELPETIGNLRNLVILNLSDNNLHQITEHIGCCTNLEVLDLRNNKPLKMLPDSLGRIHGLRELDIDSTITYPPNDVCSKGINEILKFLLKNIKEDIQLPSTSNNKKTVPSFDTFQGKIELHEKLKQEKQNERLRLEEELWKKNQQEVKMQQMLQNDKKKLLEDVKNKQESFDAELIKAQEQKKADLALLIKLCQEEEEKSYEICKLMHLRKNLNLQYSAKWEKERKEEEEKLFALSSRSKALEKQYILASMEEVMKEELLRVQSEIVCRRIIVTQSLVSELKAQNKALNCIIKERDKNNARLIDALHREEELQKSAVISLLEKSDAATWELSQQVAMIEAELAELTRLELSKKRLNLESQVNELNNSRIALTQLLMEVFAQQAERRKALINTIRRMESMREAVKDSTTFWMEQYEMLLRSKSHQMVKFLETVPPKLVQELFLHGVFHYLPLLKDVVSSAQSLEKLNRETLTELGVTSTEDCQKILSAIKSFLISHTPHQNAPSAPVLDAPTAPFLESSDALPSSTASYLVPDECVICFERKPDVIFVPCGHVCCCYKCFTGINLCPLCRKPIDAAHKKVEKS